MSHVGEPGSAPRSWAARACCVFVFALPTTATMGIVGLNVVGGLAVVCALVDVFALGGGPAAWRRVRGLPCLRLWVAYLGLYWLSCAVSVLTVEPGMRLIWGWALTKGPVIALLAALYLPSRPRPYLIALLALTALCSLFGLLGFMHPRAWAGERMDTGFGIRAAGEQVLCINNFAGICACTIAALVSVPVRTELSARESALLLAAAAWLGAVLSCLGSRAASFGLVLALVVLVLRGRRWQWGVLALACVLLAMPLFSVRYSSAKVREGVDWRLDHWRRVPTTAALHPYFGFGLRDFRSLAMVRPDITYEAHNEVLTEWVGHGPVTAAAFLLLRVGLLLFLWRNADAWRASGSGLAAVAEAALLVYIICSVYGCVLGAWRAHFLVASFFVAMGAGLGPARWGGEAGAPVAAQAPSPMV